MATLVLGKKNCTENPLKSSAPLGAALAFLGIDGAVPLFHGAQGCTAFALVLAVRHFKEAIPLQTTAMRETTVVLGGKENLEEALVNVVGRMKPRLVGVASTALVETRGEDIAGSLAAIVADRRELDGTHVVFASTPDFEGALEDGWAKATSAILGSLVLATPPVRNPGNVINVLPGVHETAGSIAMIKRMIEAFGLVARVVPDLSGSLDGHVPDSYVGTSLGGATVEDVASMADAIHTLAIGEHMRAPAEVLSARTGVPHAVLPTLIGLEPADRFVRLLMDLSGRPAPAPIRRERSQLVDAMLDGHFHFSGKRVAIAADPDLLAAMVGLFSSMGAEVVVAVAATKNSPLLRTLPCPEVVVGDLADLETLAERAGADWLVTHSHGRQAAERLQLPLFRVGFPIFDRLGHQHRALGGYTGTRELVFELANQQLERMHAPHPESLHRPPPPSSPIVVESSHAGS